MILRRIRTLGVGVLAATLGTSALGAGAASAASLGSLVTAQLTALTMATSTGAKTVIAWENFTGATGATIVGTTTDGGAKVWAADPTGAVWQVNANRARSSTADSALVVNAGTPNFTAVATVARNGATTFDAGFSLDANAAGTQYLSCEWTSTSNGSIELWKYNSAWTPLASVTNLYPGGIATAPSSIVLSCGTTATTFTASINGVVVVSYTLTAAEQTMFKNASHQLGGMYQYTSNGVTWDDFHLDSP